MAEEKWIEWEFIDNFLEFCSQGRGHQTRMLVDGQVIKFGELPVATLEKIVAQNSRLLAVSTETRQ